MKSYHRQCTAVCLCVFVQAGGGPPGQWPLPIRSCFRLQLELRGKNKRIVSTCLLLQAQVVVKVSGHETKRMVYKQVLNQPVTSEVRSEPEVIDPKMTKSRFR